MDPQKRSEIVARLKEIIRELERHLLAPIQEPDARAVEKLRAEKEELESSLEDGSER